LNAHRLEVSRVPRYHDDTMDERRCGDESIPLRAWIRHVKRRCAPRYLDVDRKDAGLEWGDHIMVEPSSENAPLRSITPLDLERALLEFHDRDD
jgi:hypothetical protein